MRLTNWSGFTNCAKLTEINKEVLPMDKYSCSTSLARSFKSLASAYSVLNTNISTKTSGLLKTIANSESLVSPLALL